MKDYIKNGCEYYVWKFKIAGRESVVKLRISKEIRESFALYNLKRFENFGKLTGRDL